MKNIRPLKYRRKSSKQWKGLIVRSYHVTYAFESESIHYSCLNVKELLAWNRREIWGLSNCNGTRTQNHSVRKRTLSHLDKLANGWVVKWLNGWVFVYELNSCEFDSRCKSLNKKVSSSFCQIKVSYIWEHKYCYWMSEKLHYQFFGQFIFHLILRFRFQCAALLKILFFTSFSGTIWSKYSYIGAK